MFLLSSDERSVRKALDMRIRSLYLHRRLIVLIKMAIFLVVIVLSILFINSEIKNVFIKFSKSQEEKKIMKDLEIDQLLPPEEVELPPMPGFEKVERHPDTVYMSTTICGDRIEQAIIMIKSAIALCRNPLHIILMTEDHLRDPIEEAVNSWSQDSMKHVTFEYHGIMYPDWLNVSEWKWLYSLCSTHKIFLPSSLRHIDAVVLADTDVLFLRPVTEFYNHIRRFRPENVMGLAIESPAPRTGWYPSHRINIPIYKDQGLNGGVWLMNLTRLRQFRFERRIHAVYEKYKERDLFYGDQDIVSIFFSYYPVPIGYGSETLPFRTNERKY
ncbi:glucoside xylosyltransferase 2-like isoform X2 [Tachypleus tridentatus]|uniref:glucoside xylosyltransferase 2-like isoform X2 n=1 Tax=Tachypleus tridentatus TaxID=6853 RepID=UPI003FD4027B